MAWACSPQATVALTVDAGFDRSASTVRGSAFPSSPVKIHWGSATGQEIGSTQGPSFSIPITIPDAQPGVYYIVATTETADGTRFSPSTAFEVLDPNAPNASAGAASPSGQNSAPAPAPAATTQTPPASSSAPARITIPAPAGRQRGAGKHPHRSGSTHNGSPRSTPSPVHARTRTAPVAAKPPTGAPTPSRAANSAGPAAATHRQAAGPTRHPAPEAPRAGATPSQQSLSFGDLSRGFSSPSNAPAGPSLAGHAAHAAPAGTPLTAGMILLGTGLMALFGGFLTAGLRRRRSAAGGDGQPH